MRNRDTGSIPLLFSFSAYCDTAFGKVNGAVLDSVLEHLADLIEK